MSGQYQERKEYFEKNKNKINEYRRRKYAENKEQMDCLVSIV